MLVVNPPASVMLSVPPRVRLPITATWQPLVPSAKLSIAPVLTARLLENVNVPVNGPGSSVAPSEIDHSPLTVPAPCRVWPASIVAGGTSTVLQSRWRY